MKPLTNEEIEDLLDDTGWLENGMWVTDTPKGLCRLIEAEVNRRWEREVAMQRVSQFAQGQEANPVEQNPFTVHQIIQERNSALDMVRKVEELNAELMERLEALQAKPLGPIGYVYSVHGEHMKSAMIPASVPNGTPLYLHPQAKPDADVHMHHCAQDEFEGACKYGDSDCPALQAKPVERNFCPRCGKRLSGVEWDIHTCTAPYDGVMDE